MLSRLGEGRPGLLLAPAGQLDEWGRVVHQASRRVGLRVQVAHGTSRATRRLRDEAVDLLIATPETALALQRRSRAPRRRARRGAARLAGGLGRARRAVAPLMQDLDKEAQRIVLTSAPERAAALVERYARRALTLGAAGARGPRRSGRCGPWACRGDGGSAALSDLVELLDPTSLVVWTADRARHEAIAAATALREPEGRVVTGDAPEAQVIIAFDLPDAGAAAPAR